MGGIAGLSGCCALRVLTIHSTPLASMPAYRAMTLSLCSSVLCLDGAVVTDKDVLREDNALLPRLTQFSELKHAMLPPQTQVDEKSSYEEHALAHVFTLLGAYRNYSTARPHLCLQRVVRGHRGRLIFRARRAAILPAVCCLQRWLLRRYIETKAFTAYCAACHAPAARRVAALSQLPPAGHIGWLSRDNDQDRDALYFFASDIMAVQALNKSCRKAFSSVDEPVIQMTDVVIFRCADSVASIPGMPLVGGVVGRLSHTHRSSQETCNLLRIKAYPQINEIVGFSVVGRHGYHVNAAERRQFWTQVCSAQAHFSTRSERVIRVSFGSSRGCTRFAAVVSTVNRILASGHMIGTGVTVGLAEASMQEAAASDEGPTVRRVGRMALPPPIGGSQQGEPMRFFLPLALRRIVAACAIQSMVRSTYRRRQMQPSLGTQLLRLRSARMVQGWWRWRILRLRLRLLAEIKLRAQAIHSSSLYCVTPGLHQRLKEIDAAPRVLRESRVPFDISHKGHVLVLPFLEERDDAPGRALIPRWLNINIAVETLEAQLRGAAIGQRVKGLLHIAATHAAGVAARGTQAGRSSPLAAHARAPRGNEEASRFELNGLAVPRPSIMGVSGVPKVTFDNVDEARARMALVLINSWRPRSGQGILLVPEEEAVLRLQATLMQAIFRGYVSRRWFAPLRQLMAKHLKTSLFDQQRLAWAAHGQAPSCHYSAAAAPGWLPPQLRQHPQRAVAHAECREGALVQEERASGWAGDGRRADERQGREESTSAAQVDAQLVMRLQTNTLRLAGLRPMTGTCTPLLGASMCLQGLVRTGPLPNSIFVGGTTCTCMHACMHARTHARTRARTHTHSLSHGSAKPTDRADGGGKGPLGRDATFQKGV